MTMPEKSLAQCVHIVGVTINKLIRVVSISVPQ